MYLPKSLLLKELCPCDFTKRKIRDSNETPSPSLAQSICTVVFNSVPENTVDSYDALSICMSFQRISCWVFLKQLIQAEACDPETLLQPSLAHPLYLKPSESKPQTATIDRGYTAKTGIAQNVANVFFI